MLPLRRHSVWLPELKIRASYFFVYGILVHLLARFCSLDILVELTISRIFFTC